LASSPLAVRLFAEIACPTPNFAQWRELLAAPKGERVFFSAEEGRHEAEAEFEKEKRVLAAPKGEWVFFSAEEGRHQRNFAQ
jgi:hypothetical protein